MKSAHLNITPGITPGIQVESGPLGIHISNVNTSRPIWLTPRMAKELKEFLEEVVE